MIKQKLFKNYPKRVNIIGVPISVVNMDKCIEFLFDNWKLSHGNYICVSNVHTTVIAHDNIDYYKVQFESLLSLPDGKPLSIIGKRRYPEMDRVTGPDFMREVFKKSKEREITHFFYGSTQENLDTLIKKIKEKYPWIKIVGKEPSVFRDMNEQEENELANRINATKADFIWIALGAPRQELFCYRNRGKINGIMVGVGGAFSILAETIPEAPQWMKNMSLEWLYRLLQEPRRLLKRYVITNTKFIYYLLKNRIVGD
ncbi:WecB/TagA/CpsF family glycosyltransferase [Fusobacterium sp. SYSU M8D902]|uniref:WecB/TagA/CpsF family glycosyltransferase n=1 Tax=Fusobacterium sp. SYSU M8D902 TaxID=3159562 RepID=UPI0032E3E97C